MNQPAQTEEQPAISKKNKSNDMSDLAYTAGVIIGLSYPILAFSTGGRAIYQLLFKEEVTSYLPPAMSAVAATCYLFAAIGFAYRRRWAWWLSASLLALETLLVLLVGTLSFYYPEVIGRTVWRHFGADYGYFPLVQPLIGLFWLFSPTTLRVYEISLPWLRTPVQTRKEG
jgi:hypothetical protein